MKKLLSLLLALSFTVVFAYDDDDYDDDYYEDEAPKKAAKKAAAPAKKAAKASSESSDSRMGFAVGFNGNLGNRISFVYDLGSGIELGLGLEARRETNDDMDDAEQKITIVPSVSYELGKGLLNYGIGLDAGIILEPISTHPDGGTSISVTPYFYTSAELVKNVSLKLSAGVDVYMPDKDNGEMIISLATSGTIIFYFL